jgi:tetratricopeptide (TPR) repeat protein
MAQQTSPVKRTVAIKLIKPGMDSKQVLARFEVERQALALMDHPNIAKVHDAGTAPDGRPYFVMELVKGVPITKYCDERRLTPRQRLELFIPVCQAIQHAHQKGIIHRDIKPSNVLVALYDGRPVPKVIDFGVAKATGQQLTEHTLVTGFGAVVGTLEYMSPEQAELNQLDIDTRSDIYSLGVLLYELLTGSPPFSRKDLERAGMLEMLRVIREQEPARPSTKLSTAEGLPTLAANRGTEPAKLARLVRGELDWIVMKALDKDRSRRYETANGFAVDVQRYLADEPVQACPPSAWYRLRKLARRNKAALIAGTSIVLALILGIAISTWQAIRATEAEGLATDRLVSERAAQAALDRAREEKGLLQTRINRELTAALVEAAQLREKARTAPPSDVGPRNRLRETIRAAETLAGSEMADPALVARVRTFQEELKQDEKDRAMLARVEEIWLRKGTDPAGEGRWQVWTAYQAAFREYGLPIADFMEGRATAERVEETARRIAASSIRDWLIAALDDCVSKDERHKALLPIAQRACDDPWRREYFAARISRDAGELLRLAKQPEALTQPPPTLLTHALSIRRPTDSAAAIALLKAAQRRHPADVWINLILGEWLDPRNFLGSAAQARWQGDSVSFYRAALAARPDSVALQHRLADALFAVGRLDDAADLYRELLRRNPNDRQACLSLGGILVMRPGLTGSAAIPYLTKAIEMDPTRADGWRARCGAYCGLYKFDEALKDASEAIRLDQAHPGGWALRGQVYAALQEWEKSASDYTRATALAPTTHMISYSGLWWEFSRSLQKLNRWAEAVAALGKAVEMAPNNDLLVTELAWFLATCPDAKVRDPKRAIAVAKRATELAPNSLFSWRALGIAHFRAGDWQAAVAALEKSRTNAYRLSTTLFLCMALQKLGHTNDARKLYEETVPFLDRNPYKIAELGESREELQRFRAEAEEVLGLKKN